MSNVEWIFAGINRVVEQNASLLDDKIVRKRDTDGTLPPGGGDMDQRIINLEQGMTDVKVSLGRVEVRLDNIEKDMFTKGQAAAYALVAVLGVLGGGWWVVQQYLSPLLAAAQ